MTWPEPDDDETEPGEEEWETELNGSNELEPEPDPDWPRWPLHPGRLLTREREVWWEQLWEDTCRLRQRYRLPLRSGWWEDGVQVEALAALAAWVERYDSGEWDDPPGKLGLLFELERLAVLLRDGRDPFHPGRDRPAFVRFVFEGGDEVPSR